MKKADPTQNTETSLRATLANLDERRGRLDDRRADAEKALEEARAHRSRILGGDPAADLTEPTRLVRHYEDEIETVDGVLADLAAEHDRTAAQLAAEYDRLERDASAKTLRALAVEIDTLAAEAQAAAAALGDRAAAMIAVLPEDLKIAAFKEVSDDHDARTQLVAAIVAEGLAHAFPGGFVAKRVGGGSVGFVRPFMHVMTRAADLTADVIVESVPGGNPPQAPVDLKTAASAAISGRLRVRASAIVAGTLSSDLRDIVSEPSPTGAVDLTPTAIVVTKPFVFVANASGEEQCLAAVTNAGVAKPVAAEAVRAGYAVFLDSPEGQSAWADEKVRRSSPLLRLKGLDGPPSPPARSVCHDLGDPCGFLADGAPTAQVA